MHMDDSQNKTNIAFEQLVVDIIRLQVSGAVSLGVRARARLSVRECGCGYVFACARAYVCRIRVIASISVAHFDAHLGRALFSTLTVSRRTLLRLITTLDVDTLL